MIKKNFKAIYYLRWMGFPMIPNTSYSDFIFIYFYWHVHKIFDFWDTPKIHIFENIKEFFPWLRNWNPFGYFTLCPYYLDLIKAFSFFQTNTCKCHKTHVHFIYHYFLTHRKEPQIAFSNEIFQIYRFSDARNSLEKISKLKNGPEKSLNKI